MTLVPITNNAIWDEFVASNCWGHPLQLWGWGEAKRGNGWIPYRLALMDGENIRAGAQVLLWSIPRTGRFIVYVPRGPVVDPHSATRDELLSGLSEWARLHRGLYVRVEPAWLQQSISQLAAEAQVTKAQVKKGNITSMPSGWRLAANRLQLPETYTIDLTQSVAEIQAPMSRKHRQYIRKAERDGVTIRQETAGNLRPMYDIYSQTALRAGFGIHTEEYYAHLLRELGEFNALYYAEVDGQPVAFLWLVFTSGTAYELYGGVTEAGQEAKANYFLKWTAISSAKAAGISLYDFNGRLNEGVSRFKEGFGADETHWIGTYDFPLSALGYQLWEKLWPVAKPIGRKLIRVMKR